MFYFPLHYDSGNRGCEAIARGTSEILKLNTTEYVGLVRNIAEDEKTGVQHICNLVKMRRYDDLNLLEKVLYKIIFNCLLRPNWRKRFRYYVEYKSFLKQIDNLTFLTGGDMLCYDNNEVNYISDYLSKKEIKTVLWGCSIGKDNLTPEKIKTLHNISTIVARESLTQKLLLSLGLEKVYCYPDPAFVLEPEQVELPRCFNGNQKVVGVNLSNFVEQDVKCDTMIGKNILNLIEGILSDTELNILLIPHVFWKDQDDRIICSEIYNRYKDSNRIHLLKSEELNYCQIRYIISKCEYFVGARTHSMISAYAMQIPGLALGYSVKALGIARDIGISDRFVVNCNHLETENDYKNAFFDMVSSKQEFIDIYKRMPQYIQRAYSAKNIIDQLQEAL